MPYLFHQNMRVFGGGTGARNAAYQATFAAEVAAGGYLAAVPPVWIAGFTEVTNNLTAANVFSGGGGLGFNLCAALGVNHVANVACGQTLLANGPEYIALGVHPACAVLAVGRIFLNADWGIRLHQDISLGAAPPIGWQNHVPAAATRDYRGLVYMIVNVPNGAGGMHPIAVGFLHNLYTLEAQRILVMQNLPQMLALMGNGAPAAPVAYYIGGDFNVGVVSPRGTARLGYAHAYSIDKFNYPPIPPIPAGAPFGYGPCSPNGTLWGGNLYDYWFSNIYPGPPPPPVNAPPAPLLGAPVPMTINSTLNAPTGVAGTMSDHCGTALQIV